MKKVCWELVVDFVVNYFIFWIKRRRKLKKSILIVKLGLMVYVINIMGFVFCCNNKWNIFLVYWG